jgi:hypothetical protein
MDRGELALMTAFIVLPINKLSSASRRHVSALGGIMCAAISVATFVHEAASFAR